MIKLITKTEDFIHLRQTIKSPSGFVPTMGNLHQGHLSLVKEALKEYDFVFFSIFVNPKQFGPNEDFNRYPRTLDQDMRLLTDLSFHHPHKEIIVFAPENPNEVFGKENDINISSHELGTILEGAIRPGHFDGVVSVVYRLFQLVKPTTAYFGLKDYQQCLVIDQMVQEYKLNIKLHFMPIIREDSGLALSSRNQYLSIDEKKEGLILSQTLKEIMSIIDYKKSNLNKAQLRIKEVLKDNRWNYLELRDAQSLSPDIKNSHRITLLGVFQLRTTRLLDNMQMEIN